jgi:hypothetical protein
MLANVKYMTSCTVRPLYLHYLIDESKVFLNALSNYALVKISCQLFVRGDLSSEKMHVNIKLHVKNELRRMTNVLRLFIY